MLTVMMSRRYVHYDVKPANILFIENRLVLADTGLSRHFDEIEPQKRHFHCGTVGYVAPEVMDRRHIDLSVVMAADMWSFGVTLVNTVTGMHLWQRENDLRYKTAMLDLPKYIITMMITYGGIPHGRKLVHVSKIALQLLQPDPRERLSSGVMCQMSRHLIGPTASGKAVQR